MLTLKTGPCNSQSGRAISQDSGAEKIRNFIQRLKRAKCSYLQLCSNLKTININLFETTEKYSLSGQPDVNDCFARYVFPIFARENNIFLINLQFCQVNLEVLFPAMALVSL